VLKILLIGFKNIMKKSTKISIIGVGYVGLPLALAFSKKFSTVGFDLNKNRIDELKNGYDSFNDQKKKDLLKNTRLLFSSSTKDINSSDYFIITVPTPVNNQKIPDLKPLISASKIVGKNMKKKSIVIYESTVYPGCTEEVCVPLLEKYSGLKFNHDFFCGYSPERINVGDKKHRLENIKKIVSGSNINSLNKINSLYSNIIKAGVHKAETIKVAEAAKVIENTQRDLNIALVNEFSLIFDKLNIKTDQVLNAAATKWNFIKFSPGLVGGHCVGVDPYYLTYKAKKVGYNPKVILSGRKINDNMSKNVCDKILKLVRVNDIKRKPHLLILGYGFKENCSDIRNSKVIDLVNHFLKKKIKLNIFDPLVNLKHVNKLHKKLFINKLSELKNFIDVFVLAVPHNIILNNFSKILKKQSSKNYFVYDIKSVISKKINKYTL